MQFDRDKILTAAEPADLALWEAHARAFVTAFVQKPRRDRWLFLLLQPTEKTRHNSHKLHADLDRAKCREVKWPWKPGPTAFGIYDQFTGDPKLISTDDIMLVGPMYDSIYSLVPGKRAVFFFHEGEMLLCE
ncbi:hypothetical protein NA78x_001128 [Anatilimnocola sp. NA78]|uniref:hypothetical protein n=1 Tax=Anatilimnocola sp. NA78 TaxID=3415683 RepID=UPI003CE4F675